MNGIMVSGFGGKGSNLSANKGQLPDLQELKRACRTDGIVFREAGRRGQKWHTPYYI